MDAYAKEAATLIRSLAQQLQEHTAVQQCDICEALSSKHYVRVAVRCDYGGSVNVAVLRSVGMVSD